LGYLDDPNCLGQTACQICNLFAALPAQIDLGAWLPQLTWEEEDKLWEDMTSQAKVLLTPGGNAGEHFTQTYHIVTVAGVHVPGSLRCAE